MALNSGSRSVKNLPPATYKIFHPDLTSRTAKSIADSLEFGRTLAPASNGPNKRAVSFEHSQIIRQRVDHPHPVQVVHSDGSNFSKLLRSISFSRPNPYAFNDPPPGSLIKTPGPRRCVGHKDRAVGESVHLCRLGVKWRIRCTSNRCDADTEQPDSQPVPAATETRRGNAKNAKAAGGAVVQADLTEPKYHALGIHSQGVRPATDSRMREALLTTHDPCQAWRRSVHTEARRGPPCVRRG